MAWIPSPRVPGSKQLGSSKADLALHLSEVNKPSTRAPLKEYFKFLGTKWLQVKV